MDWKNEHPKYEYAKLEDSVPHSPWLLWDLWQQEAKKVLHYTNEIVLATANKNSFPSARMLLLKHASKEKGFCFFSNRKSKKGIDISQNPQGQILWYCNKLQRQVRIYGTISELPQKEVEQYAFSRPRNSQISAYISQQSKTVSSKQELLETYYQCEKELQGRTVPLSKDWTGYSLQASTFEFWQGASNRLHDRIVYTLTIQKKQQIWTISRLYP